MEVYHRKHMIINLQLIYIYIVKKSCYWHLSNKSVHRVFHVTTILSLLECENNGICLENAISWSWLAQWKYVRYAEFDGVDLGKCK